MKSSIRYGFKVSLLLALVISVIATPLVSADKISTREAVERSTFELVCTDQSGEERTLKIPSSYVYTKASTNEFRTDEVTSICQEPVTPLLEYLGEPRPELVVQGIHCTYTYTGDGEIDGWKENCTGSDSDKGGAFLGLKDSSDYYNLFTITSIPAGAVFWTGIASDSEIRTRNSSYYPLRFHIGYEPGLKWSSIPMVIIYWALLWAAAALASWKGSERLDGGRLYAIPLIFGLLGGAIATWKRPDRDRLRLLGAGVAGVLISLLFIYLTIIYNPGGSI